MSSRVGSPGTIAAIAVITLLAVSSCSLIEPFSRTGGDDEPERPDTGESAPQEPGPEPGPETEDAPDAGASDQDAEGTAEKPEEAPPAPGYEVLARGQQSAIRVPLARAITDPALWADLWAALTANQADPPARPEVAFDEETVVVLLLGERRTGGYAVRIDRVHDRRSEVEVVVEVQRPAPGDMVTQALTSPYFIATIPVTDKPVVFSGDEVEAGFEGD